MKILRRSLRYLKPYTSLAIGAFLMMNIVTICSLIIPQCIEQIIDEGITKKNLDIIKGVSFILIGITLVRSFCSFFNTYWAQKASQGIAYDLRNEMIQKLEYLEFSFHDQHNIGQLLTRATNDVEALRNFFGTGILQIIASIFTLIGSVIILLNTQWNLFLAVVWIIPIIMLIFFLVFKRLGPIFGSIQQKLGQLNTILQQNILGIRIVKGFTAEDSEREKYDSKNQEMYQENLKMIRTFASGFPVIFFVSNIATAIVIWMGGNQVIDEKLSIGTLIAFNSYLTFLVQPIFQLGFVLQQFARANASGERIFQILDTQNSIVSTKDSIPFEELGSKDIMFNNVNFSYNDHEESHILKNITLCIRAGTNTAIIGKTGSGKSTLVNLIPRYYDATDGEIMINNINLKSINLESLRENIGMVLQEIRLLNGSIRENITFGKPGATEEEILEVCTIAQVDTFLENYEEGLDFQVGEGGKNLSGGQPQRIAIARMLLVEPTILILDDALSALDANTENQLIQEAQPYLNSRKHTVIVISQKINTIQNADLIVLMEEGKIAAEGTHDDLMKYSETYRKLVHEQSQ